MSSKELILKIYYEAALKIHHYNTIYKMKKLFFTSALFLLSGTFAFAQFAGADSERIQEMRVQFFNEELQFSPKEAEDFWPIYNNFREEKKALKASYKSGRKLELMTDAEAEEFLEQHLDLEEKQLALKRQYINRLKPVISIRKIAMINRTERKFKQALLRKIKEHRGEGNRGNKRKGFN